MRNHPVNALLQITGIGLLNAKLLNHRWVRAWVSQLPEDIAILLYRRLLAEPQDSQLLHLQILGLLLFRPWPCPITGCSFVCITRLGFAWTYLGVHQFSFFCYGTSPHNPTSPCTSFCLSEVGSCCCNIRPSSLPASRHVLLYEQDSLGFLHAALAELPKAEIAGCHVAVTAAVAANSSWLRVRPCTHADGWLLGSILSSQQSAMASLIPVCVRHFGILAHSHQHKQPITGPRDLAWQRVEFANWSLCLKIFPWQVRGNGLLHFIELFLCCHNTVFLKTSQNSNGLWLSTLPLSSALVRAVVCC